MRSRTRGPPTLRWTMLRNVTLVNVRRESGCVLAPQLVTQCVSACARAGARPAAARAAGAHRVTFLDYPPGYGIVVDRVKTSVFAEPPVRSGSVAVIACANVIVAVPLATGPSQAAGAIATRSGVASAKPPFISRPGSATVNAAS